LVDVSGTAADSSPSNVFTISGTGYEKACAKKENIWDVAEQSNVKTNNNKDRNMRLVIVIFFGKSFKILNG